MGHGQRKADRTLSEGTRSTVSPSARTGTRSPSGTTEVTSAMGHGSEKRVTTLSEGTLVNSVAFSPNGQTLCRGAGW